MTDSCANRGTVHQSFPDFTFLTGNWLGKLLKLKGELDPNVAMNLCNKASLAFLQRHLCEFIYFDILAMCSSHIICTLLNK